MITNRQLRVIKKDGTYEDFNPQKIINAITKSAQRVMVQISDEEFNTIVNKITGLIDDYEMTDVPIADMHKFVEATLDELNPSVAKSYRDYRNYKIDFVHIMDKVYERSKAIRYIGDKENANTDSALVATKRSLIYNELNKRLYRRFFMTADERQACRDGYIYIHDQSSRLDTSINCFARSTKFISDRGLVSFYDYQDGDECMVISHKGIWRRATVHYYGQQRLQKVTLQRGANGIPKEIFVTPNHRWLLKDGTITTDLKVGDKLILTPNITRFEWNTLTRFQKKLWCIGFGIGDGAIVNSGDKFNSPVMMIRLCGDKIKYADRFRDCGYNVTSPESLGGDMRVCMGDVHTKEIPHLIVDYTNILYLINGLMCADGNRNMGYNNPSSEYRGIQVTGDLNQNIKSYLSMAGYYVTSTKDLSDQETNFGWRSDQTIHYQCYSDSGNLGWTVKSVDKNVNMREYRHGVWCLDVEVDHSFLLEGGIPTGNCCLCDVGSVMKDGFEMGNIWYNEPKSLDTAFDVLGDIILSTASQQYGGFTVPEVDKILSPYAEKSYKKYRDEYLSIIQYYQTLNPQPFNDVNVSDKAHEYAMKKVKRDFEQGFQGIEMKLNTVGSSRGDYPFITMTFGIATDEFGRMASKTFLEVHMKGQGKEGFKKPVLFPKLVFLYDENLHGHGGINEDIYDTAIECSSATMYPDYLSLTGDGYVPEMYKKYGRVVSPMGKCKSAHVKRY